MLKSPNYENGILSWIYRNTFNVEFRYKDADSNNSIEIDLSDRIKFIFRNLLGEIVHVFDLTNLLSLDNLFLTFDNRVTKEFIPRRYLYEVVLIRESGKEVKTIDNGIADVKGFNNKCSHDDVNENNQDIIVIKREVYLRNGTGGVTDHSKLTHLNYDDSGHTGFQRAGNYIASSELAEHNTSPDAHQDIRDLINNIQPGEPPGSQYILPQANELELGGITAAPKTEAETKEVKIDSETGRLYAPGDYYTKEESDGIIGDVLGDIATILEDINDGTGEGGTGGVSNDYNDLENKPQINGIALIGNKASPELGLQPAGNYVLDTDQRLTDERTPLPHIHPLEDIQNLQSTLDGKQDVLLSGVGIKTINGQSILGAGNIEITGGETPVSQGSWLPPQEKDIPAGFPGNGKSYLYFYYPLEEGGEIRFYYYNGQAVPSSLNLRLIGDGYEKSYTSGGSGDTYAVIPIPKEGYYCLETWMGSTGGSYEFSEKSLSGYGDGVIGGRVEGMRLTHCFVGKQVTGLRHQCFINWESLQRVYLENGLKTFTMQVFANCTSLEELDLPESITDLGTSATFEGCSSLARVIVRAVTPPSGSSSTFTGLPAYTKFYVPDGSVDTYKARAGWNTLQDRIFPISGLPAEYREFDPGDYYTKAEIDEIIGIIGIGISDAWTALSQKGVIIDDKDILKMGDYIRSVEGGGTAEPHGISVMPSIADSVIYSFSHTYPVQGETVMFNITANTGYLIDGVSFSEGVAPDYTVYTLQKVSGSFVMPLTDVVITVIAGAVLAPAGESILTFIPTKDDNLGINFYKSDDSLLIARLYKGNELIDEKSFNTSGNIPGVIFTGLIQNTEYELRTHIASGEGTYLFGLQEPTITSGSIVSYGSGYFNRAFFGKNVPKLQTYVCNGYSLKSVTIGDSVTDLESYATRTCQIDTITMPATVASVEFSNVTSPNNATVYTQHSVNKPGINTLSRPTLWACVLRYDGDMPYVYSFTKTSASIKNSQNYTLNAPYRRGYTFAGWYANADYTGGTYTADEMRTAPNATYYAKWEDEANG